MFTTISLTTLVTSSFPNNKHDNIKNNNNINILPKDDDADAVVNSSFNSFVNAALIFSVLKHSEEKILSKIVSN
jgi:hypothetical protein